MKKIFTLVITLVLLYNTKITAQTGIGTKTVDVSARLDISSTTKGVLIPRVSLTSLTQDLDGQAGQATGLLIFNSGTSFAMGFYYWDGSKWKTIDNKSVVQPEIATLVCSGATLEPSSFTASTAYTGILRVPYTGGNGGSYSAGTAIASTVNTGLTATLKSGTLEFGNGFLVYDVVGTPAASSPTGASFSLSFGTTTPQSCTATVGVVSSAKSESIATLGPLLSTSENGFNGFHRSITSPDGKFSVRVFVRTGENFANADLQIRTNNGAQTIMWNGLVGYQSGTLGTASNALVLPTANIWYGNNGPNSDSAVSSDTAAWGDADVYFNAPEQRFYIWTTTNVNDKTIYLLKFMMGAPNPNVASSAATAANTKAFLQIEQILAN